MTRSTPPLPDDVSVTGSHALIAVLGDRKSDSPAQKRFRQLIDKVERLRKELKNWQNYALRYRQRVATEVEPLHVRLQEKQRQMVRLIDEILSRPDHPAQTRLQRGHRALLREMIREILVDLLPESDEELAALRQKHGVAAPIQQDEPSMEELTRTLEEMFGVKLDENHGATNARELFRKFMERMNGRSDHASSGQNQGGRAGREPARPQAGKPANFSLREVYRRLVSMLHPDREPDLQERERKNRLMQQVNQAYETHDLLTLLNLQIQLAQVDEKQLASPERLGHYTELLRQQIADLETQLQACRMEYAPLMGGKRRLTPQSVDQELTRQIAQMQWPVRELEEDLVKFRDPVQLRKHLEEIVRQRREDREEEELLESMRTMRQEMEAALAEFFDEPTPQPRRRRKARRR